MADQKSAVVEEKKEETVTSQTSSPQVEESTTEAQTTQEEVVDQGSSSESSDNLPVGSENWTAEQRKAFQEQRQEIKRLKEQVARREESESAFSAFRQQAPPVGQTSPVRIENYQNEYGETNWQAYNQAVQEHDRAILSQARFEAQQVAEEIADENNARSKHEDLFKDKYFEQRVADRWLASNMRGENKSISQIADDEADLFGKAVSKAEKIGAEKALNEVSEKEQAGLSASGQTSESGKQAVSESEYSDLVMRTRKGSDDAIAERISKIPWTNK